MFRLATSPSAAFLMLFPTIGYYTFATYANVFLNADSNIGGVLIRSISLAILFIAWFLVPNNKRVRFGHLLAPAVIFIFLYGSRLLENMWIEEMRIPPGNDLVLLILFLSGVVPAIILASMERAICDEDMIALLSLFSVTFVIGMWLNREVLMQAAERRMMLDKVNPIALAYSASSFIIFYLLSFARSKRTMVEAVVIVPILLIIVSLARSRGMMISTGVTLAIYIIVLRGTRRIWTLAAVSLAAVVIGAYANPEYIERAADALSRLDADNDMSTAGHLLAFQGAWNQFLADPIFGRYAIELVTAYYPHNIYLESLMSVGIIGTVPFLVHCGMSLRAAIGLIRERDASFTRVFIALLFIRDAVGAAGSGAVWSVSGFWIASFLVIMMWYGRKRDLRLLHRRWRIQSPMSQDGRSPRPQKPIFGHY
ncbi:O-antigen ligase family protein [Mesorhizobium sp.]|uniref:O-antigen ligase family protein n=1 Tax=Mesorhizobium sp. TaxID=1871066 RepID=UPI000FE88254|nr:O-antigen ligase family protein [Mesorhizobium sp.]RWM75506.1 MAG: O-antigen ligase domain-containing protein [Mesorhizobium sp.]TIO23335.1 MAG: O-antigen ligase family protein [Mesorhizobium sp.]TJV61452.1 MAG: O-antigen ligase family protein [Mesorhizobium sp.]